ncbi:peptidylprolyl isomerase [Vagococcus elongatus]|uniref:Foldase protein PrsA n=1 Tax=Vagococcus elongatus TaxID=180344 RepID=A0A430AMI9_9ENTE|nr:peptidylprolyl isomerase [Vagococcus elongatus]RSU09173.1 hypothetical protein CBF29_11940 [Vagococcus elongatus]
MKKIKLAIIGLVSAATLTACSSGTDVVTMKGSTITVDDIFQQVKTDDAVKQSITQMIINEVAVNAYGDKVEQKAIDKQFNETKKQYGDAFASVLESNGMTEKTYKENIKNYLAYEQMLKSHVDLSDADLKEVWADFHPEVEVQLIAISDEEEAKKVHESAKNGDDFAKLAEENSNDASASEKGKVTFDSTSTTVPTEVKEAAFQMKDGDISDVIKSTTYDQSYQEINTFYIVKMVKQQDKGNDMKPFKKQLKEIATNNKLADQQFQFDVLSKEFKKANVKIKDEDLTSIVAQFMPEETESTDSSADDKTKETNATDSEETEDTDASEDKETTDETK